MENLVSLIMSFVIFFAGYEIVREVFAGEVGKALGHLPVVLSGVILTILITFVFSRYELKVGREIGSPSLIADGQHVKTDMLSSVVILVGLTGHLFGLYLDRVAALVVVLFIARAGWGVMVNAVRVLLDASLDFETLDRVKTLISEEPKVREINGLWGRSSGRYKFIEADITVGETRLQRAHSVSRRLEERIKAEFSNVDHILIHYAPIKKEFLKYAIPLADYGKTVSEHFGKSPFFKFVTVKADDGAVTGEEILVNPYAELERGKGIKVAEWLVSNEVDVVFLKEEFKGGGPTYVLADADVEVRMTDRVTVEEILSDLDSG